MSTWPRRKSLRITKCFTLTSHPSRVLANTPRSVCSLLPQLCFLALCSHLHQLFTDAAAFQWITGSHRCPIGDRESTSPLSIAKSNANYKRTEIFLTCLEKSVKFQGLEKFDFDKFRNIELALELTLKKFEYIPAVCLL